MKTLFIPTCTAGVNYWRMLNPVNALRKSQFMDAYLLWWQKSPEMHPWQADVDKMAFRSRILNEMDGYVKESDAVVMGMIHLPGGEAVFNCIREDYKKPVIMEIDDHILSCPTYNPAAGTYDPNSRIRALTIKQLRGSDAIFTTTPYLKEAYSEFNDNIYVLPNAIDFPTWNKAQRKVNKGKITIGWVGGANHNADLLLLKPAIEYLTDKYPEVEFVFGHGMHPDFRGKKGVRWIHEFFRIDKYPKEIAKLGFDIGVAPLVDNAFNRGKSNLRWLEYSALGIPTVASKVGHFAQTIEDGKTGLLCEDDNFIMALECLIKDKKKRKEIAKAAKAEVMSKFNIDTVSKDYEKALSEIIERKEKDKALHNTEGLDTKTAVEAEVVKPPSCVLYPEKAQMALLRNDRTQRVYNHGISDDGEEPREKGQFI